MFHGRQNEGAKVKKTEIFITRWKLVLFVCETVDFFKICKTQRKCKTLKISVLSVRTPIKYGWVPHICRYWICPTFFQKFFIFFIFFHTLGYIFYLNFRHFSPIFHVFSAYFSGNFGLILCCWSIGFSVLFLYGCLRVNGKFRQKAILLLV